MVKRSLTSATFIKSHFYITHIEAQCLTDSFTTIFIAIPEWVFLCIVWKNNFQLFYLYNFCSGKVNLNYVSKFFHLNKIDRSLFSGEIFCWIHHIPGASLWDPGCPSFSGANLYHRQLARYLLGRRPVNVYMIRYWKAPTLITRIKGLRKDKVFWK